MMTFGVIGPNERAIDRATERVMGMWGAPAGTTPAQFREILKARGMIVGSTDEVVEILGRYGEMGLQEVQFQHFNFDSDEVPEYLAAEIAPRVKGL
jgi:alkanesulfonate monooxygenase SsuD/methylene tetrahydromethanopterin reductase-like flavin-dependent oxidoreductase (luciferase family)